MCKAVSAGTSHDKTAFIISDRRCDIVSRVRPIAEEKYRHLTVFGGAKLGKNEYSNALICIFSQNEITKLKETVKFIDNKAFIILLDINDVYGNGFKKF